MKPNQSRVNAPVNWWGIRPQQDIIIPPTYPDGVRCSSEQYRVDSYKIKSDDEGLND